MENPSELFERQFESSQQVTLNRAGILGQIRLLSQVNSLHGVWSVVWQWLVVAMAMAFAVSIGHWIAYLLAIFIIGTRQSAMDILVHDAAHYRIHKDKRINDWIGEIFLAYPNFFSMNQYRKTHMDHHRYLNTDKDPDPIYLKKYVEGYRKEGWKPFLMILKDLVGLGIPDLLLNGPGAVWSPYRGLFSPERKLGEKITLMIFSVALVIGLTWLQLWFYFLVLWVLPRMTVAHVALRIRSMAEHEGAEWENELNETRLTEANWFERLWICPCKIQYHIPHHLFPSVPFYNLPKLNELLMKDEIYQKHIHITYGYLAVFKELKQAATRERQRLASSPR